jgi:hypothetical protein
MGVCHCIDEDARDYKESQAAEAAAAAAAIAFMTVQNNIASTTHSSPHVCTIFSKHSTATASNTDSSATKLPKQVSTRLLMQAVHNPLNYNRNPVSPLHDIEDDVSVKQRCNTHVGKQRACVA